MTSVVFAAATDVSSKTARENTFDNLFGHALLEPVLSECQVQEPLEQSTSALEV